MHLSNYTTISKLKKPFGILGSKLSQNLIIFARLLILSYKLAIKAGVCPIYYINTMAFYKGHYKGIYICAKISQKIICT